MKTAINNMVILRKDLSDEAFKLYCILAVLAWNDGYDGSVSISALSEISGKTPETVQTLIKELEEKELVSWAAHKLLDGSKYLNTPSLFGLYNNLEHFIMDNDPQFGDFTMCNEVMGIVVFPEAYELYRVFAMLAGEEATQVKASIKYLSKLFGKTAKETRKWLQVLTYKGIIETTAPDTYIVHDYYRDTLEG